MKKIIRVIILIISVSFLTDSAYSRTKDEVNLIISDVQKMLNEYPGDIDKYASAEIEQMKKYIQSAASLLKSNKIDEAYFDINIAKTYFLLIDSKKELYNSEKELEDFKKSYGN